jgi:hypothetical protein
VELNSRMNALRHKSERLIQVVERNRQFNNYKMRENEFGYYKQLPLHVKRQFEMNL